MKRNGMETIQFAGPNIASHRPIFNAKMNLSVYWNKVLELQKQLQLVQEQQQTENAQANANAKKLVEQNTVLTSCNSRWRKLSLELPNLNTGHFFAAQDVSLLAAQLQNEKATVSRAVAQNLELKSQLKELQDRLIAKEPIPGQTVRQTATKTTTTASTMTEATAGNSFTNTNASPCDVGLQTDGNERDTNASTVRHFAVDASSPLAADAIPPPGEQQQQQPCDNGENGTQIETTTAIGHQQHDEKAEEGTNLATQLEALCRENALYRRTNERLEYWLTALESENESIGEYIALYRFQRTQIQQRIAEKDAALLQLQQQNTQLTAILTELRNAMLAIMQKSDANAATTSPTGEKLSMENSCSAITEGNDEHSDSANPTDQQKQQQIHPPPMDQLAADRLMRISEVISRQVTCMAANQAQIHCTGCVECQGELFNI
ncbi:hypothetical protein niasHS_012338 [Heterodera schachtii]|uniref:Golgin subfamily A conserved domain-containing protein n=1 Tax=Heterodera schachtii TaxID=97005 RepID=A0ABD2IGU0_HETSC